MYIYVSGIEAKHTHQLFKISKVNLHYYLPQTRHQDFSGKSYVFPFVLYCNVNY